MIARSVSLLIIANIFMTAAWYGHLRWHGLKMWQAILIGWGLALFEYLFQVPANRLGYGALSGYQLKILQEAITLTVFIFFAWLFLGEPLRPRYLLAFALIFAGVGVAFSGKP